MMGHSHSDFLPADVKAADFSGWTDILPERYQILGASLFADVFLTDVVGSIHMLGVSTGLITRIAASERQFYQRCTDDEEGWLSRPLVDRCRSAGMHLGADQCYAFTTLPMFGGEYDTSNIWVCPWREWINFTAEVYAQTKNLPDGAKVRFEIVD
jgi:hypothetical protein